MIQCESIVRVADNSGAKTAKCIKILGGYKKKYAKLGDLIIVSIQELRNKSKLTSKVKKGDIYTALVIQTKKVSQKKDGSFISYLKETAKTANAVILISRGTPAASRITEPIPHILRKQQLLKFINVSSGLI